MQAVLHHLCPGKYTVYVKLACALPLSLEVIGMPLSCPDVCLSVMGAAAALDPIAPASSCKAAASARVSCLPPPAKTCERLI